MNFCVLDDNKVCDQCKECLQCDIDPSKICDNCCSCLEKVSDDDYATIMIDEIIEE